MSAEILTLYKKVASEGKHPELELRIFDGFGKMDLTKENFETLLGLDIFDTEETSERSLTFTRYKKRVELTLGANNRPSTPVVIEKKRLKAITNNEIGMRISLALEIPAELDANVLKETKFYRYRERVSKTSSQFPGWRFDFTKVHQVALPDMMSVKNILTKQLKKGVPENEWQYEVEVEYVGTGNSNMKKLEADIENIGKIVTENVQRSPMMTIQSILKRPAKSPRHLMNQVVSLSLDDVHRISTDYAVTEKADGLRMLLYIDQTGNVYEIPSTGLRPSKLKYSGKNGRVSLIDAEYLEEHDRYLLFDLLILNCENVTDKLLPERYELLEENFSKGWKPAKSVRIKEFYFDGDHFGEGIAVPNIFAASKKIYKKKYDYYVDGLIYTPMNEPYFNKVTYKWKPPKDLTIDLLIREPDDNLVVNKDGLYKVVQLFFLIGVYQWKKYFMRNRKLTEIAAKTFGLNPRRLPKFFPFPFAPGGDTKPFYAKVKVSEVDLNKYNNNMGKFSNFKGDKLYIAEGVAPMVPILDNMVVEFAYDPKKKNPWIPYRFRKDKTEDYFKGLQRGEFVPGPNGWNAAMKNWELIHEPVTEALIFGDEPLPEKYYKTTRNINKKTGELAKYMYKFNNHVKRELYKQYVKPGDKILEIAGGRGGDIDKAISQGAARIVITDQDGQALKEAERRSISILKKFKSNAQLDFLKVDLNQPVGDEIAGVIGDTQMDIVSCQFAFHYFMGNLKALKNITKIVDRFLKPGGYFIFTSLDGKTVFDLLKGKSEVVFEKNGKRVASIDKLYSGNRMTKYGQEIDVYIEKIGLKHKEFLLNFDAVIKHFEKMGYNLVETEHFSVKLEGFANSNNLSEAEQAYTSINRYAVLQKSD